MSVKRHVRNTWVLTWNPERPLSVDIEGPTRSDCAFQDQPGSVILYNHPEYIPRYVKRAVCRFYKEINKFVELTNSFGEEP